MESAPEYTKLISSYDTGEQDGLWLTANYGKGTHASVVWYRQLETAMVPNAYRMFVNMLNQTK